jgi:hypothetical protein
MNGRTSKYRQDCFKQAERAEEGHAPKQPLWYSRIGKRDPGYTMQNTEFIEAGTGYRSNPWSGKLKGNGTTYISSTGCTAGVSIPGRDKIFLLPTTSRPALGPTQPPIALSPGAHSSGVKRQKSEADHSPKSNAEIKNGGAIPPPSHTSYRIELKHRDNFTFIFA